MSGYVLPVEWGAQVDYTQNEWTPWNPEKFVIHYGGGANYAGSEAEAAKRGYSFPSVDAEKSVLRAWENWHINGRGWLGIAYNYAIGQSGTIYQLRGENRSGATRGDEDNDGIPANHEARAVVFILGGNQVPTEEALDAFRTLYNNLGPGLRVTVHSDYQSTSCPGDNLRALVDNEFYLEDIMQFTEEEATELKNLVLGLKQKDSTGYGLATNGIDLIRAHRTPAEAVDEVARSAASKAQALAQLALDKLRKVKEVL